MPRRNEPDPLAAAIGSKIKSLREVRGLKLEQLAFESGMTSKGHLSDLEHGRVNPTVATLRGVAAQLGVGLFDLVNVEDSGLRARLVERSRDVPAEVLARWLAEAEALPTGAPAREASTEAPIRIVRGSRPPRGAVPVVDLEASAGLPLEGGTLEPVGWVKLDAGARALPGAFVAQVRGDSMVPRVPDGAYCLFRRPGPGNRQGRVFLIEDSGGGARDSRWAYALTLVERARVKGEPRVTLRALNPAYPPRTLLPARANLRVVAELVRVLPIAAT